MGAERAKEQRQTEMGKLDALVKKHEELIPNVQKTAVMVDLYWKCYAYGDELKPHVEFLDEEAGGAGEGVGSAGQHRHRAQLLGGQGQVRRGREPVLSGEDGVHPGRAQEHLQAEGEAGGGPVILLQYKLLKSKTKCCMVLKLYSYSNHLSDFIARKQFTEAVI